MLKLFALAEVWDLNFAGSTRVVRGFSRNPPLSHSRHNEYLIAVSPKAGLERFDIPAYANSQQKLSAREAVVLQKKERKKKTLQQNIVTQDVIHLQEEFLSGIKELRSIDL